MKKYIFVLAFCVPFGFLRAQLIITTQYMADSIALQMDTVNEAAYIFRNDTALPLNDRISDLSGFIWMRKCNVIELDGFDWKDMPWFTNLRAGTFSLKNMNQLDTVSGLGQMNGALAIDGCNSLKFYPPKGAFKTLMYFECININIPQMKIDLLGLKPHSTNRMTLIVKKNESTRIEISDPESVCTTLRVEENKNLKSLHIESSEFINLKISRNLNLEKITGFTRTDSIFNNGILDNPKLSDMCVLRNALNNKYKQLSSNEKQNYPLARNAPGANSYQEMMAYDCTLGNEELTVEAPEIRPFAFYPNPSNGVINLRLNEMGSAHAVLRIVNLMGEIVSVHELTQLETELDISRLRAGHYLINVRNGEKNATSRFVKLD
ncbi:MAG: T9SS type A sorting domain-containing protein [Flavobacteriales bacterium]|nr:T9SS type A sorting domain-containing protein [Flavobacteriales bacterium]